MGGEDDNKKMNMMRLIKTTYLIQQGIVNGMSTMERI